jgi:ABC-type transport system involved in Fe-S cluster assembly fused permease/ATPase subunit
MTRGIHADVLMNFETVKNFTAEAAESERYRQAIEEYQQLEFRVIGSLNFLNLCQNLIMSLGVF